MVHADDTCRSDNEYDERPDSNFPRGIGHQPTCDAIDFCHIGPNRKQPQADYIRVDHEHTHELSFLPHSEHHMAEPSSFLTMY